MLSFLRLWSVIFCAVFLAAVDAMAAKRFHEEYRRAHRHGTTLSVLLADIDRFKSLNDTYGHQVGDYCLREVAQTLARGVVRAGDVLARYGGEEFVVLLSNTDDEGARKVAENLRAAVASLM